MELYRKYRPKTLEEVVGQDHVTTPLKKMLKEKNVPHFMLFGGPSGVGKTSVAKALRAELGCDDNIADFTEKNAASERGIEMVRDMKTEMQFRAVGGKVKFWILDEAAKITPDAQGAMLTLTENVPDHVYIVACTMDPDKIHKALRQRATRFDFKPLSDNHILALLDRVAIAEDKDVDNDVVRTIIEASEGSARQALVYLEQALAVEPGQQFTAVRGGAKAQSIELCRILLSAKGTWRQAAKILKALEDEPEGIRHHVLAYMTTVLLDDGKEAERAAKAIRCFQFDTFHSKKAGLVLAAWEFFHA